MERETRKFTTINGHEVEVVTYVTGRELRDIQSIYLSNVRMLRGVDGTGIKKSEANAVDMGGSETYMEADNKRILTCIVAVNGNKENVLDSVLDMRSEDYEEVMKAIDELTVKKNETKP